MTESNFILVNKQKEVIALPTRGHFIVLGTAGCGKSTMAVFRALHLAKMEPENKVLLITYNNALVRYLQHIFNSFCITKDVSLPNNLTIENYHKFARGYLKCRGQMNNSCIITDEKREKYIKNAIREIREEKFLDSNYPDSCYIEYIRYVQELGINNLAETYNSPNLYSNNFSFKNIIFEIIERYNKIRQNNGFKYDWYDIAYYVYNELLQDSSSRLYKHIIIDEGQDFSPIMLNSLIEASREDGSITFFGDVAQQIYCSYVSWRNANFIFDNNKIWQFNVNYRNTSKISKLAQTLTNNSYWGLKEDIIQPKDYTAEGPTPILIKFSDVNKEIDWVINKALKCKNNSTVAIICRNWNDINCLECVFKQKDYQGNMRIDRNTYYFASNTIYFTTYHSAKGLEFDNVIVPFLNDNKLPDINIISNVFDEKEFLANELRLLYVAITRSKFGLYMTYSGNLTPFLKEKLDCVDYLTESDI